MAVVSYRRFTAGFNGEVQSRVRLLRRLNCLCLAEAGHLFGLPRSPDPTCPLSYVNDLQELDAKSDKLSDTCRHDFETAFAAVMATGESGASR
jgi:predicted Zn-dependent protease